MNAADLPCACTALRKAARAVSRAYDEALAGSGLTTNQFAVLRHAARLADPPLSRLAESLVMDRTSLYRTLQPMVRAGWLEIVAAPRGRAKLARLTPAGRAVMESAAPAWEAAQAGFLARFGAEPWAQVNAALSQVVAAAEA
jgi:DNA-binding MarR family transcriptional regulator